MANQAELLKELENNKYKYGFVTDIEAETVPLGLNEEIIRLISAKKERAEMAFGMALKGISTLVDDERADLGQADV